MKDLNLNQLLRYGFAGAVFFVFVILAYSEPRLAVIEKTRTALITAGLVVVGLTAGCVIYSLHRAITYPIFYCICAKINRRRKKTIDLDIIRWKNLQKKDALQPRLSEWGDQVHFLYCIAWAGFLSILLGLLAEWTLTKLFLIVMLASIFFFVSAFWHHYRYQKWEKRVFDEDYKKD